MLTSQKELIDEACVSVSSYLSPNLVLFLERDTRDEVLEDLVKLLHREGLVENANGFYQAILAREDIFSTGIGMGVAVPHAKLEHYDDFFLAVGIHPRGVAWNALDGRSVRLIFMIGGPDDRQGAYLRLLSRLTMALKDDARRKKMLELRNSEDILDLFKGI
ncbi:Uncharacterized protein CLAVI_000544 [Candidatus Clavichlamydia salmonicola]|uniref:PTS sugar transporter subunit IIA n=1 Tax=Candidatus Clavichlamydia salmonicola TaxID=469812 RepID=UPI0018916F3F|nr:PTS sugar transporter subunit IIA [Candidatus Clavichlamydia salmonicola]MBF5050922.1 Uncharacterized protein [Candidatus Clavichlamydia salmonicola]